MKRDLGKAFRVLIDNTWIRYRGCLIEKRHGGFAVGNDWYSTRKQAEEKIDRDVSTIGNSISNPGIQSVGKTR